jgi:alcohol dehydrogenase
MTRHRARGTARQRATLVSPTAAMFSKVALERQAGLRLRRLSEATRDRLGQRRTPMREKMRALTVGTRGRVQWREVPVPRLPGPDGAIVHPIAIATCDLDRLLLLGRTPFPLPLHFGHECVAEVLSVGEHVVQVRPGDRVVVPFQISCGTCAPCRAGHTGNCASVPPVSMYGFGVGGGHWGGAVSDQLAVPYADAMLVPLPSGVEPAAAASVADNVCDGYRHIGPHANLLENGDGEVLILAGMSRRPVFSASVPLYAGLVARALGARHVHFFESRDHVRRRAEQLGLEAHKPSEIRQLPTLPLVVDATASPSGIRTALEHTAPDGVCSSVGMLHRVAPIPAALMFGRNVTLHIGRSHARALIPNVLELVSSGRLRPELVTSDLAPIDDAPRAIGEHMHGDATKTILVEGA